MSEPQTYTHLPLHKQARYTHTYNYYTPLSTYRSLVEGLCCECSQMYSVRKARQKFERVANGTLRGLGRGTDILSCLRTTASMAVTREFLGFGKPALKIHAARQQFPTRGSRYWILGFFSPSTVTANEPTCLYNQCLSISRVPT